jgi:hypothetical protein
VPSSLCNEPKQRKSWFLMPARFPIGISLTCCFAIVEHEITNDADDAQVLFSEYCVRRPVSVITRELHGRRALDCGH